MKSDNDEVQVLSKNNATLNLSRTNSFKKQHVHWSDGSTPSTINAFHSSKGQKFTSLKQAFFDEDIFNTIMLTESPSIHRSSTIMSTPSSALFHFIQTAIIPAGSTVGNIGTSQWLIPTKECRSILVDHNNVV